MEKFIAGYGLDNQASDRVPPGGHEGFKFLSEKNTLVPIAVYRRYHRMTERWCQRLKPTINTTDKPA